MTHSENSSGSRSAARLARAPLVMVFFVVSLILWLQGRGGQVAEVGDWKIVMLVPSVEAAEEGVSGPSFESVLASHLYHTSGLQLIVNLLVVVCLGRLLESRWGTPRFLVFYFVCSWGGTVATLASGGWFGGGYSCGSSSLALGSLVATGVLFPDVRWGSLPRVRYLVWSAIFLGGAGLYLIETPISAAGVELRPILLPQLAGVPLALGFTWALPRYEQWLLLRRERSEEMHRRNVREIRRQVDHLLDKISAHGYDSLSGDELTFLRDASKHFRGPEYDGPSGR